MDPGEPEVTLRGQSAMDMAECSMGDPLGDRFWRGTKKGR